MSSSPRIAIIGGGPAGLTLGIRLQARGIPFTIFELRQKLTDEELTKPSGMLDLHDESGLAALRECGLYEDFMKLTGECTQDQHIADKHGEILYKDEGEMSDRPEVSRHALTKMLLSQLPDSAIQWGHKLVSATESQTSELKEIVLDFGPNGKYTFDLVIGADGAWSKVRTLLTDIKPHYTGMQNITVTIRNLTTKYPHLAELLGKGSFSALGDHHGVMSHRGTQDSARLYICFTNDDEQYGTTSGLASQTPAAACDMILQNPALYETWGPKMKELIAVAGKEEMADNPEALVDIRPLHSLPVGHSWEHSTAATLIGDAAHLMCPWAGEGVNLAMWDSLLLAGAIGKAHKAGGDDSAAFQRALGPLTKEFETELATRAGEKAQETVDNGKMLFGSDDGARAFVAFFESFGPPPE